MFSCLSSLGALVLLTHEHTHTHTHTTGWLVKEGKVKRRRYFVLTEKGQLHCYRTEDTRQPLVGNIHLNWYVVWRGTGDWASSKGYSPLTPHAQIHMRTHTTHITQHTLIIHTSHTTSTHITHIQHTHHAHITLTSHSHEACVQ